MTAQLAQAKSTQRYVICANPLLVGIVLTSFSDEYWKLYDQYAEIRQKLADAEDLIDTTKRQLDDARAERKLRIDRLMTVFLVDAYKFLSD